MPDDDPKQSDPSDPADDEGLYELEQDESVEACPSCGEPWPSEDAIVCIKCGLNLRTNQKVTEATADAPAVEVDEPAPTPLICQPGWLSWKVIAGAAGAVLLFAVILSAMTIPLGEEGAESTFKAVESLRILIFVVLAEGLGLLSVLLTSRMTSVESGDLRIGATRIGMALALAALVWSLPWEFFSARVLYAIGASLTYAGAMWLLFRKAPDVPRKVLPAMHFLMMIVLSLIALL